MSLQRRRGCPYTFTKTSPGKVDVVVFRAEFYKPILPAGRQMSHTERPRRRWPSPAALLMNGSTCGAKHFFSTAPPLIAVRMHQPLSCVPSPPSSPSLSRSRWHGCVTQWLCRALANGAVLD